MAIRLSCDSCHTVTPLATRFLCDSCQTVMPLDTCVATVRQSCHWTSDICMTTVRHCCTCRMLRESRKRRQSGFGLVVSSTVSPMASLGMLLQLTHCSSPSLALTSLVRGLPSKLKPALHSLSLACMRFQPTVAVIDHQCQLYCWLCCMRHFCPSVITPLLDTAFFVVCMSLIACVRICNAVSAQPFNGSNRYASTVNTPLNLVCSLHL